MKRGSVRTMALVFLSFLPVLAASAHPHVFIDCKAAVIFEGDKVTGFHLEWTFDEMFSQMIIADYDRAGKGSFSPTESEELRKGAFDNLRNYHYFLAVYVDGAPERTLSIRDFRPSIRKGRLVYDFTIPLAISVPPAGRELRITVYDDSYYLNSRRSYNEVSGSSLIPKAVKMSFWSLEISVKAFFFPKVICLSFLSSESISGM